jgi:hypothetical protein
MFRFSYFLAALLAIAVPGATAAQAADGPFGISMGEPGDTLVFDNDIGDGYFVLKGVPSPHSHFESYVVMFHPSTGICLFQAVGIDVPTGPDGAALKVEYEFVAGLVSKAYGNYDHYEHLADGSILAGDANYMNAIVNGEMSLQASWDEESNANLKQDIGEILLLGKATDAATGYVLLQYRFTNWAECSDKIEAENDAPF